MAKAIPLKLNKGSIAIPPMSEMLSFLSILKSSKDFLMLESIGILAIS